MGIGKELIQRFGCFKSIILTFLVFALIGGILSNLTHPLSKSLEAWLTPIFSISIWIIIGNIIYSYYKGSSQKKKSIVKPFYQVPPNSYNIPSTIKPIFENHIHQEIIKSLPLNCQLIPKDRLLGLPPCRVTYAFQILTKTDKTEIINIMILPADTKLDNLQIQQLIQLRDYILNKNCMLIIICEDKSPFRCNDLTTVISEYIDIPHHSYLSLYCYEEMDFKTTINGEEYETVNTILRDLYSGHLYYEGPRIGKQTINLELMKDKCWKCKTSMKTVTGIVFPNKKLEKWNNTDWQYYNHVVHLINLEDYHIKTINSIVDRLRKEDSTITPIEYRYIHTTKSHYWAAICPNCKNVRGNHYVQEARLNYIHDFKGRINKELEYKPFEILVDQKLLQAMNDGYEGSAHTCLSGWQRSYPL